MTAIAHTRRPRLAVASWMLALHAVSDAGSIFEAEAWLLEILAAATEEKAMGAS